MRKSALFVIVAVLFGGMAFAKKPGPVVRELGYMEPTPAPSPKIEARIRLKQFGGNFGVVPFFDGGSLTTEATPDFSSWKFAAGLGVRYYSSFGPIRIDVGVPLNREKGDGPFAVTVSLGQAF